MYPSTPLKNVDRVALNLYTLLHRNAPNLDKLLALTGLALGFSGGEKGAESDNPAPGEGTKK